MNSNNEALCPLHYSAIVHITALWLSTVSLLTSAKTNKTNLIQQSADIQYNLPIFQYTLFGSLPFCQSKSGHTYTFIITVLTSNSNYPKLHDSGDFDNK